jgi:hypothetical protein
VEIKDFLKQALVAATKMLYINIMAVIGGQKG